LPENQRKPPFSAWHHGDNFQFGVTMKKLFRKISLSITFFALTSSAFSASLTDAYENKIADLIFRGQAFSESSPANYYVALYTSSCTDSTPGTEVSAGGYARVAVARSLSAWNGTHGTTSGVSSGTNGTVSNAAIIQFGAPTANWGVVTAFGILDASSSGNQIVCNNLTTPKTINNGDAGPSFAVGALTVQVDN
jgi:hypothetical protein